MSTPTTHEELEAVVRTHLDGANIETAFDGEYVIYTGIINPAYKEDEDEEQ